MKKRRRKVVKKESWRKRLRFWFFSRYLDEGEELLYVAHRHVLVFKFMAAKTSFFGFVIPLLLWWMVPQAFVVAILWMVGGLIGMLYHFVDWYFDAWLLTNVGVIDVERDGFFDFTSTRVDYHMIEGISYNIAGFLATVFRYGDITIDKLGTATKVMLKDAANPKGLERLVVDYQEKFLKSKSIKDHDVLKNMLSEMINYHSSNGMK